MAFIVRHQTPIILIVALAVIACLSLTGDRGMLTTLTEMFIRLVVVIGLYTFVGNSGVVSFGHVGFMCIGAYATAWMTVQPSFKQIMLQGLPEVLKTNQFPFPAAMGFSITLPAVVAFVFGLAILRLTGMAAAIATFAFLMIVNSVYSNWDSVTAGVSSMIGIPKVVGPWTAFAFGAVTLIIAWVFQRSRYGLMLRASRDDEVAAKASGIDIKRVRLVAFILSAAMVGAGGGLYAQFLGILTVDQFFLGLTFVTIAMLVVGGMFSLSGAVVGVVVVTAIVEVLRMFERGVSIGETSFALPAGAQEIGLGVVMALILIFRPSGLTNSREVRFVKTPEERADIEASKEAAKAV